VNLTTKNFFAVIMFFLTFLTSKAQIQISEWVVQPPETAYTKPLIYIDFWATWCAPCISSIPHTQGLAKQFEDEILFIFISQEPQTKVAGFMKKKNLHFYSAIDYKGETHSYFHVNSIPQSVILGPSGEIIWQGSPSSLNKSILYKLLKQYGNKTGNSERIKIIKEQKFRSSGFQNTEIQGQTIRFKKYREPVIFNCHQDNEKVKCSGSTQEILSKALQVYPFQIETEDEIYWEIIFDKKPDSQMILAFFKNQGYKISIHKKEFKIFELVEKNTENWLNAQIYNYSENNEALAFADDSFLIIDNATPSEMARFLTQFTRQIFIYQGQNSSKYDWNIQINNTEETLKFLIHELDFQVQSIYKTWEFYKIKK